MMTKERGHPLILAYAHYLEVKKELAYGGLSSYLSGARKILDVVGASGYPVSSDLAQAHIALKRLYEDGHGLLRILGVRLRQAKVTTAQVNSFETFLAQGLPLARRWHEESTRTILRALAYLDGRSWREHVAPLVFAMDGGFQLLKVRTQEQREAIDFINSIGGCVDCGRTPMVKGVVRERRGNRRTGGSSMYLVVSCGEVSAEGNPCQRGWRATTARLDVEDSLLKHNPSFVPRARTA